VAARCMGPKPHIEFLKPPQGLCWSELEQMLSRPWKTRTRNRVPPAVLQVQQEREERIGKPRQPKQ
jgi:hypothetical protein